jgi:hypothetical protein
VSFNDLRIFSPKKALNMSYKDTFPSVTRRSASNFAHRLGMAKKNHGQNYSCSMSVGASLTLKIPKLAEFFNFSINLFLWAFNCKKIKKLLPNSKIQNGAQI